MRNLDKQDDGLLDGRIAFTPFSIKNDVFDIDNFEELKSHSKKLLDSEAEGKKTYEQFPELQQDMFDALFKYEPELNQPHELKRDFLLNKKIMEEMLDTPRYKELRAMTQLDIVNSTIGTELLSDQAMELIKKLKEQRKRLQDVIDEGAAMDAAQQAFDQANPNGPPGAGKHKEELELEEAERRYEEAMEAFEEAAEREDVEREVDRMVAKVQDEVRETSEAIANWGLGNSASFQKKSPHEKMELVHKLRNSDKLKDIARLTGRFRRLAQVARREKVKQGLDSYYSITQGDEISRLLPAEIMRLLLPVTRKPFLLDLLEKKTLVYDIQGKQKKGKGPVIICIDSSGSMDGLPEIWSKAVALVLLEIAREQKRDFFCIHFSSGWRGQNLHTNEFRKADPFDGEQLLDMAEYFEAGGTEFEPPLDLAREKIGNDRLFEKADVIFVTDGQSVIRDEWLKQFKQWKEENKVNIYSVLIDSYDNSVATVRKFSDRVDKLSNLRDSNNNDSVALDIFLDI